MPIVYLTPEDLTLGEINTVLAFLNSAGSAREIGERVEFIDERDVGEGVGQRILDRRRELGGVFTDIQQLWDVPYVGPERFTETVVAITGRSLEPIINLTPGNDDLAQLIANEVARQMRNQTQLAATHTPYRVELGVPDASFYLGEELPLYVKVFDRATGKPVQNLSVTLEADNMWLTAAFGFHVSQGSVIQRATGTDGSLRFKIRYNFAETLSADQVTALHEHLSRLDKSPATPNDVVNQLAELITEYQRTQNKHFRNAVDIIFDTHKSQLAEAVNPQDFLNRWQYKDSLLRVYLRQDISDAAVVSDITAHQIGVFTIRWKQWLLPWYQIYQNALASNNLQANFVNDKNRQGSENTISAQILSRAYNFVTGQPGRIGETIGKSIVDKEIQTFLAREATSFDAATQRAMYPSLKIASANISATNTGALAVIEQTKSEVSQVVDQRITQVVGNDLDATIAGLNSRLDAVDNSINTINSNVTEINTSVNQLQINFDDLIIDLGQVTLGIESLNTDLNNTASQINNLQVEFDTRINEVGNDIVTVSDQVVGLNSQVAGISGQVTTLNTNVVLRDGVSLDPAGNIIETPTIR